MSFEHKYLKYKQKYLELKKQLESMQQIGGASNNDNIIDLDKLSDTPTNNNINVNQIAGYLQDSSEYVKNSETDSEEINELTDTPKENTMVVNIESSTDESNDKESETDDKLDADDKSETDDQLDTDDKSDADGDSDDGSSSPSEQEGGKLETSISELDEIFSQLGGKKGKEKDKDSSSDESSLSSFDDSSSDFDF